MFIGYLYEVYRYGEFHLRIVVEKNQTGCGARACTWSRCVRACDGPRVTRGLNTAAVCYARRTRCSGAAAAGSRTSRTSQLRRTA